MINSFLKTNKILIIDDQIMIRKSMKNIISSLIIEMNLKNYEIIEGCDGDDMINCLIEDYNGDNCIKLVFTDEDMKTTSGSTAIKLMRILEAEQNFVSKTIISVTSLADDVIYRDRILKSGADQILSKPASKKQFKDLMTLSLVT